MRLAREIGEHGHDAGGLGLVAADEDDEILVAGLCAGAADRAIEHCVAGSFQGRFGSELGRQRERAHLDDEPRPSLSRDHDNNDGIERFGLGHHHQNDLGLARQVLVIGRNTHARRGGPLAASGVDIVADDRPPGFGQEAGERAAHDAEAGDADRSLGLCHCRPPAGSVVRDQATLAIAASAFLVSDAPRSVV